MAKITVGFTLDEEKDKRIIRWLNELEKGEKSREIRKALHAYLGKGGVSLGDIYEAIQDLKRCGVAVTQAAGIEPEADLPTDVMERLSCLGT